MRARASLTVERDPDGRSSVRELRSQSPLALVPRRGTAAGRDPAVTVHLVGSASTPLAGDDVELDVRVGPGADLVLTGVAAAVALPGTDRPSRLTVRVDVGEGASLQYLPEPTVITARADHRTLLSATMGPGARLRCRDVLVAGRSGERAGRYAGTTRVCDGSRVLLVQTQELGDAVLQGSPAHLAGRRVLGTEFLVWDADPQVASAGDWWSLTPLAHRGSLATAVGPDAVSTRRDLDAALLAHPGWAAHAVGG
ncbi:urease accessory protein UreD [Pseudonocardia sp. KRD291]|uniref:urease accessory protein UreD n=1 Tax=Pseudonocardia sp. KRD291 TaxID=2792007 RepID=UPI001C49F920|nr:urease accessory protein UreD [Pseudonocardia sp. KRD291]MBW0103868.1 urease accessory protein UreD [Pseudonocardia sp. KRD291]